MQFLCPGNYDITHPVYLMYDASVVVQGMLALSSVWMRPGQVEVPLHPPQFWPFEEQKKKILVTYNKQRRSNIRTRSAVYFWLIGFLVILLCIVALPVGTRSWRVRFVFLLQNELCWITISPTSRHCYKIRWLCKTAFSTISASLGGQLH